MLGHIKDCRYFNTASIKIAFILLIILPLLIPTSSISALSTDQKNIFESGIDYFDIEEASLPCATENLNGSDNEAKIWNYLLSKGLLPHQAAGFMGNMQAEAHFEPRLVEYGWLNSRGETSKAGQPSSLDDNVPPDQNVKGQPGYGIIQWTSPGRKQGLRDAVAAKGLKASDLGLQLDYMWQELTTGYKASTLDPVMASTTVVDATNIVMENYEIPGDFVKQRPLRQRFAQDILVKLGSGTTTTTSDMEVGCSGSIAGCPSEPVGQDQIVDARGVRVHSCIAEEVERIIDLADAQGLNLSGWGWRDKSSQINLRIKHGCGGSRIYDRSCKGSPPTAVPGLSLHERGTAVDFTCDGSSIKSRSHECFAFLKNNTSLKNFSKEPWHWSESGR